jgi:hypothetical protein
MGGPSKDVPSPAEVKSKRHKVQNQLDDALADTFPASDPVSIATSQTEEDWDDNMVDCDHSVKTETERAAEKGAPKKQ